MSTYQIKHSTELMENYLQATIMAPQKDFRALQSADGRALLFSIASDDAGASFNVTAEVPGERYGWEAVNLSREFKDQPCQHFAVAQRADGSLHLAIALRQGTAGKSNDTLYLGELRFDESGHVITPAWTAFAYDSADTPRSRVEVAGIFLSQATDGEHAVVDLVRDPDGATKEIVRYYVDPAKSGGHAWHLHDVPIDLQADRYASVLGRREGAGVDGVYVSGQIDGSPQIVYTPLYNELQPSRRPLSAYLKLTDDEDRVADAIAACRNSDNTSDLYATAQGVLYRFADDKQGNGATAVVATASALFARVSDLFAFAEGDRVVVWGRNADNTAFYTSCPRDKLSSPDAWSVALPLLVGVQHVSPFINRANGANTIVAHTGDSQLKIGLKSPETGAWHWRDVTLPPAVVTEPTRKFSSYTTHAQVVDEHNQPVAGLALELSASNVTSVYINHLYYQVGPEPIHVVTDATGCVTVIEAVPRLTGTQFTISAVADGASASAINPMDKSFKKATDLQSVDQLRGAQITSYANGQKLPPRNLIRSGVDDQTLRQVANLNQQCALAYKNPLQGPPAHLLAAMAAAPLPFDIPADTPKVDAGDLFQFLEARSTEVRMRAAAVDTDTALAAGESFWEMVVRWFEDAWEFVVKIGEAIYRCVLNVIEDIVSAVRWVFDKIVTAIVDLIEFLQYLFEWDDFKRAKDVIKNVTSVFLNHEVDQIIVIRQKLDAAIDELVDEINKWAGLPDVSGLGDAGRGQLSTQGSKDGPDAPGTLLAHHFQGNAGNASHGADPPPPPPTTWLQALENALKSEEKTLGDAYDELQQLMRDAPSLSLVDILKRLAAILADAVLRSAQVVIDAVLDLLHILAAEALAFFDTPIHIPVISDILNAIGIPDFSMLDVVCWVAAVPATIGYKLAMALSGKEHRAPFPDNDETKFLIESKDFNAIATAFGRSAALLDAAAVPGGSRVGLAAADGPIEMSPVAIEAVFIAFHVAAGICGWISAFADAAESLIPTKLVTRGLTATDRCRRHLGRSVASRGQCARARDPITDEMTIVWSRAWTFMFLVNKALFGLAGYKQAEDDPADYRKVSAIIDAVLVIPALTITSLHFVDLAGKPAGNERTIAILDESSFMATYVARVLYTLVVGGALDSNEEAKIAVAATMGVTQIVHGAIQFAEAAVEGVG